MDSKERTRSSGDSNQSRVLITQNQRYLEYALVTDLLKPLLNAAKILDGNPPRNTKKTEVTLKQKYNHLQSKIRAAREEITAGLERWNDKYELPIKEHYQIRKIAAEQRKLKAISNGSLKKSNRKLTKPIISYKVPKRPDEIKLSRQILSALELLDDFYDDE